MLVVAVAWCLVPTTTVRAQWGLAGQDADARFDPEAMGNAADQVATNTPSLELDLGYLAWWPRDPKLATPVAVGATSSQVLIGPDSIKYDSPFSGGSVMARFWHDNTQTGSLEVGGFILARRTSTAYALTGPQTSTVNLFLGGTLAPIAGPGAPGGIIASASSFLWGAESNLVVNTLSPVDLLFGFRYFDLTEDLNVSAGRATGQSTDHYYTRNQFYGGQLGVRAATRYGGWNFGVQGKLGLGDNHETIHIAEKVLSAGDIVATQDKFALLVDAEARVGFDVASGVQLFVAYNFLYLNRVVRPGDQLPTSPVRAGGGISAPFQQSFFLVNGLTAGVELRY
jgi:hypothetical protein